MPSEKITAKMQAVLDHLQKTGYATAQGGGGAFLYNPQTYVGKATITALLKRGLIKAHKGGYILVTATPDEKEHANGTNATATDTDNTARSADRVTED